MLRLLLGREQQLDEVPDGRVPAHKLEPIVLPVCTHLPVASLLLLVPMQHPNRQTTRPGLRAITLGALTGVLAFGLGGIFFFWPSRMPEQGKEKRK